MNTISWVLALLVVAALIAWGFWKSLVWPTLAVILALFFLSSLGWLGDWWAFPIIAAVIAALGYIIAFTLSSIAGRRVMGTVAIACLVVGVIAGMVQWTNTTTAAAAADTGSGASGSIAFDPSVDLVPAEAKCDTNVFVDHSVRTVQAGNPDKRQFSTAVSIPLTGGSDDAVMTEMTKTEICGNPTAFQMVVKDMLLWTDAQIPGADSNKSWLNTITADINSNPTGINGFVTKSSDGKLVVTATYQKYAGWVNTVLLRSIGQGKQSLTSTRNWEVSAAVDPSKGLPSVQLASVQESKLAWVRLYTDKVGTCLLRFGFNTEDRRMEIFPCPTPTSTTPGHPSTPPHGGCTVNCGGSTCTTNCGHKPTPTPTPSHTCPPNMPHGTWPVCKDDPSRDPQQQGNNRQGGGGTAPTQTDPQGPPAAGHPQPTYTPPAPVQTHAPEVKPTQAPAPQPTVAPSTQAPADGHINPSPAPSPSATCSPTQHDFGFC